METKQTYQTAPSQPKKAKFLLVVPTELLDYFRKEAATKGCFISAEIVRVLEAWRTEKDISLGNSQTIYRSEIALADPDLSITAGDLEFCRTLVQQYEAKAAEYEAKVHECPPAQKGAYKSHQAQALKNSQRMAANAAFQIEWLRRHRPDVYDEVTNEI